MLGDRLVMLIAGGGGGAATLRDAESLVTPCADALICVVPAATPVTIPLILTVATAGLLDCQRKITPLIVLPYWSVAKAVNCCVVPA